MAWKTDEAGEDEDAARPRVYLSHYQLQIIPW